MNVQNGSQRNLMLMRNLLNLTKSKMPTDRRSGLFKSHLESIDLVGGEGGGGVRMLVLVSVHVGPGGVE